MSITKEQLDEYIRLYNQGNPIISDETYDRLLEEYLTEHGENERPFLRQKQSDSISSLVGTLNKVYGVVTPMREGQKTYEQWLKTKKINPKSRIIIQPKFDGVSIAMDRNMVFFTRGDYDNGESVDVTDLFFSCYKASVPTEAIEGVKFEGIISKEIFKEYNLDKEYKTPRDAVSGIITSRNTELSPLITLIPLRETVEDKFWVCGDLQDVSIVSATADDLDCIQQFIIDKLNDGAVMVYNGDHYAIDGVVVSVLNEDGSVDEEIAIKILNDINETKLIKVDFQFGKTGRITPVAIVEPTSFCDGRRTVDHITLSTLERIVDMNLKHGDTVRLMYNIVPYFLDSYHDGTIPIQIPTKCPMCGEPLDMKTLKLVRCTNSNCHGLISGSITRYCVHMKMFGISEATVNRLYDEGLISSISDLYELKVTDIMDLEGFGEVSARNIINSIEKASSDIPISRWLGSLPFKDVNAKTWNIILNTIFGDNELRKSNYMIMYIENEDDSLFINECLLRHYIPGIGDATKRAIHEGWLRNIKEMRKIIKHVSFKITSNVSNNNSKGIVTFTGIRDKDFAERLIKSGYAVGDFSNNTTILIVPDKEYVSNKVVKARKLGIPIYTITEANKSLM